jgi:hypothetical protein
MPDYFCYPLWEASPGEVGNIDPRTLPISRALQQQLVDWAKVFDDTLDMSDPHSAGFKSEEAIINFNKKGAYLAEQLRAELGGEYSIIEKFFRKLSTSGN